MQSETSLRKRGTFACTMFVFAIVLLYVTSFHLYGLLYWPFGRFITSGKPAMLVSNDSIPARADDDATISQFTSENTAEVPIVAIAVCAIVFSARIHAALNQSIVNIFLFMMFNSYSIFFKSINSCVCRFSRFLYCFKLTGQMKHSVRTKMV